MNTADFGELSGAKKEYFYKCKQYGEMVDKRGLDECSLSRGSQAAARYSVRRVQGSTFTKSDHAKIDAALI
jgi:hypothetical protein